MHSALHSTLQSGLEMAKYCNKWYQYGWMQSRSNDKYQSFFLEIFKVLQGCFIQDSLNCTFFILINYAFLKEEEEVCFAYWILISVEKELKPNTFLKKRGRMRSAFQFLILFFSTLISKVNPLWKIYFNQVGCLGS